VGGRGNGRGRERRSKRGRERGKGRACYRMSDGTAAMKGGENRKGKNNYFNCHIPEVEHFLFYFSCSLDTSLTNTNITHI
jgi:hypothetical protein